MKYIVSWSLPHVTCGSAVARFLETGGAPPAGVRLVGRWHGMSGQGFAIAESDDPKAMYLFQAQWSDLLPVAVTPCLEDAEAGEVLAGMGRRWGLRRRTASGVPSCPDGESGNRPPRS